ncbi:CoA transferase [Candidatus Sumerlaeota bacterium]|nr:CoA transferase [Candidatus Sumerlaeota bacterium]
MAAGALRGMRVVEFAEMISGPYCGKLLADSGADVIKVESARGDASRAYGPFPDSESHPERSALFMYANTSKRGVVLDLAAEDDLATFKALLRWADVLIDNHTPDVLEDLGLGWDALHDLNPCLVYVSITPYGRTGPRSRARGDELTIIHASGLANLLPTRSVDISRAPVKMGGCQVGYHGAVAAAVATLGAVIGQKKTGRGQLIDVSLQEVMLNMVSPLVAGTRYQGTTWSRVPDRPPAMGRMRTQDGYVILNAFDDHHFQAFREVLGNPEWCAGDQWKSMKYRANHLMDIAPNLDAWMLKQKKDDVHHRAARKGIAIGPIATAEDVMKNPQFAARDFFTEVSHPEGGTHRYAGLPFKMSASPPEVSRPAPLLGQHNGELQDVIAGKDSKPAARPARKTPSADGELPLKGVRVLEFCWVWAGPYAGMLLGNLGADVIKVEGHTRMDLARRSVVWPLAEPAPQTIPPNQGLAFNTVNRNKKGITLDLTRPEGVELARRLAAKSDIVIDNMRPGALAKLGLGYDALKRVRQDIIVASSSGRGSEGPESKYLGYAMVHHGIGGGAYITGYPDDHPCHSLGDVDIMNATAFAFATLTALYHRDRTGEGQFIDYSQCEAVSALIGEVLLGYEMTSVLPERAGNAHPYFAPHNVYKAWGVDRWIALEVHSDEEFDRLAEAIGMPELAHDVRFETMEARKRNEAELDRIIEAWTSERDRDLMVTQFAEAGLMAAPSRDARDLYADPHLRARGAFVTIDHPELGELELVAPPWKMSDCEIPAQCAPLLGEHTDQVLTGVLGLSDADLAALRDTGIIL